ncbi:MAG: RagB/SusD family nutrient uptake outer membrane protein [Microscillaceae bacterium]|jgi:hypothetical protein|nr:RagB/SusD family nutrient uptake outer membrane protein [Microscillaceae bacterium]
MKKTLIKYTICLLLIIPFGLFSSCNQKEILEPKPITSLLDAEAFATPERVLGMVNGLYASLKSGQFLGGRMQVYHEVRGEDFQNRLGNGVTALFAWQYNQISTNAEPLNAWTAGYLTINRCNIFLQGLDQNPNAVAAEVATRYRAEARFVRALAYYFMVNLYARPFALNGGASPGLPLRLTAELGPGNRGLARSTVAQVYDQILADLNFAEQNLPLTSGTTAVLNVTRAHRNAAIAFKTRVYLTMQRYADVITEAQKIVGQTSAPFSATSGVAHSLAPIITNVFLPPYTNAESIFSLPMNINDVPGVQNSLGHYFMIPGIGNGEYNLDPGTQGILNNAGFLSTDIRRTSLLQTVGTGTAARTYCRKFPQNPFTDYVPVTRYAEVLLNYAEALVRVNGTLDATAINLLNAVRGRSAIGAAPFTDVSFADVNALINTILLERRIELMAEGFRGIDITRLQQNLPSKTGVTGSVPITAPNYVWPIPQAELDNNTLMVQNN